MTLTIDHPVRRWLSVLFAAGALGQTALAAPADHDGAFAGGVSRWVMSLNGQLSEARAMVAQPDGRILFAAQCRGISVQKTAFCVMRLLANGQADNSFGTGGVAITHVTSGFGADIPQAMLLQPDGKIVVAGTCNSVAGGDDFCLVRHLASGALDSTFGSAGRVVTPMSAGNGNDLAHALALDAAGNIVVAGQCGAPSSSCLASYDATTGALRAGFGSGGIRLFRLSGDPGANESINALASDRFGRLHTAGSCNPNTNTGLDFCVARLRIDGALDGNFGQGTGWVPTSFFADKFDDTANSLVVQPDGKLVAGGMCRLSSTSHGLCLARYHGNGALDTSFDAAFAASGKVATTLPTHTVSGIRALALQPDGRIVAAGICQRLVAATVTATDNCALRYLPEGQLDGSFGVNGFAVTFPGSSTTLLPLSANAATMLPGGRILVATACANTGTGTADACVIALKGGPLGYSRCSLDLDGDGTTRVDVDALLFTRLMMGFGNAAALQGITLPAAATRNNWSQIRRHAFEQCGMSVSP